MNTLRLRLLAALVLSAFLLRPAYALFNLNEGKETVFVTGTYSIGYDSNVFTRASGKSSYTQSASLSLDYTRQAGLIGVTVNASVSSGQFASLHSQDFTDPSLAISLRKRYGRTTGTLSLSGRHESVPDPDIGQRTQAWNLSGGIDARYPVNDRYYITNATNVTARDYTGKSSGFSNLNTYSDAIAVNYVYTSKLDLNGGYTITASDTSNNTKAYDQSLTVGASGSILPKLSGSIRMGMERRDADTPKIGHETFNSFTSGTSLKWLLSRQLSFSGDLTDDFSTTATDQSVNRLSTGIHATANISSKYILSSGLSYTKSIFLGKTGAGRRDDLFQFDLSLGAAITTHLRASLAYLYMVNYSNFPGADFIRQSLTFTAIATY